MGNGVIGILGRPVANRAGVGSKSASVVVAIQVQLTVDETVLARHQKQDHVTDRHVLSVGDIYLNSMYQNNDVVQCTIYK